MTQILRLRGSRAVSGFRLQKLLESLRNDAPSIRSLAATYWHFVHVERPLSADERRRLEAVLEGAGDDAPSDPAARIDLLVVPRLGTLSPWASKATDILRHCGLPAVLRIERGCAWHLQVADGAVPGP